MFTIDSSGGQEILKGYQDTKFEKKNGCEKLDNYKILTNQNNYPFTQKHT